MAPWNLFRKKRQKLPKQQPAVIEPSALTQRIPTPVRNENTASIVPNDGFITMAYFTNWSIYARNYQPTSVPGTKLTHVLYAFTDCKADGSVTLTDTWSDTDKHFPDDPWSDPPGNLYGCFGKLWKMKLQNRNMKILLSIGGWTLSTNFSQVAADKEKRANFVKTAIKLLNDLGLDGIDIDWEFPTGPNDGKNFLQLLTDCRAGLDAYMREKGETSPYLLTIAMSCGLPNYEKCPLGEMSHLLDYFNLMAYDFAGSWDPITGHQAKLYGPAPSGDAAVKDFIARGVPSKKIVLGMPLYGRSFMNTENRPGAPYSGMGKGDWENGVYDYKSLPLQGSQETNDLNAVATSCYNPSTREWVTYDSAQVVQIKCEWIKEQNLGGAMFWELSSDKTDLAQSLVERTWQCLGGSLAQVSSNHIHFPSSKYDNVRTGPKVAEQAEGLASPTNC